MSSHKVCHLLSSPVLLRKFTIFGTKTSRGAVLPQIFVWGNTALFPPPPPLRSAAYADILILRT